MKTKKSILLIILFALFTFDVNAQTDVDALRYSGESITGTSRFTAMSGAFGALGGDFTSLSYNPAGIAIYRSSEFTFTPSIFIGNTTSDFQGRLYDENKYNFNIGNVGVIYTKKFSENESSPGWKSFNFGFGYNRLNNFHNRSFYEGKNNSNSILDHFAENSNGIDPSKLDPFYESLAYNSYLINPDSNNRYYGVIPIGQEIQRKSTETQGAIGETVFTFGGNYSNKIYIGATFGFKSLRYFETTTYEEFDPDTLIPYFSRLIFQQDMTTHGFGFDMKGGMIYRANDYFRFGASIETPTWYTMHDDYKNSMTGYLDTGSVYYYPSVSPDGFFDYDLTTPLKVMGSLAFIFDRYGLLSADYEFSDYSETRFYAGGSSFSDVNNLIRQKYKGTHTIRVGTEWLLENISFRGGVSYTTSPFNDNFKSGSSDFSKKSFSGGIGLRENNLFLDLGYVYTVSDQFYQPYTLHSEDVPGVNSNIVTSNFTITFGVKF